MSVMFFCSLQMPELYFFHRTKVQCMCRCHLLSNDSRWRIQRQERYPKEQIACQLRIRTPHNFKKLLFQYVTTNFANHEQKYENFNNIHICISIIKI
jgi:hypothetical protein